MKKLLLVIAALMATNCLAHAQTTILYQEDFGTTNGGTSLASVGWSQILVPGGYSGIYAQANPSPIDETTSQPLPANTLYFGGNPGSGIFFTTSGAGNGGNGDSSYTSIDPTLYTNLNISVESQWSYQGANLKCWFAVYVGGNWYIDTNSPITTAQSSAGGIFYQSSITYNPAAADWNVLTNTTLVGIGPQAGANLSGTIDGVGIVTVLSGSGSWNYNNFLVSSISNSTVQAPTLTAAPFSQTAYAGAGVSFAVAAGGTPLNYFWQSNGVTLTNGGRISGATTATLNIANVNSGDSGATYSVIVSNSLGEFDTSTNSTATLTVNAVPPDYLYAETFPFVGPLSVNYPLSVVGWSSSIPDSPGRLFSNGGGDGAIFNFEGSAMTTAFYVTTNSDNGATGLPFPSINPAAYPDVSLSVDVEPTYQPANITAYFAVQMSGGNWYVSSTPIPVNTSSTTYTAYGQTFSPLAANWNNLTLTSTGASIGSTASADLTGNIVGAGVVSVFTGSGNFNLDNFLVVTDFFAPTPPTITASPFSQTVYAGAGVSFAGTATGTQPLSYFWQTNGTPLTNSATIFGANSNVLTLLNVNSNSAGQYSLIASNSAGTDSSANYVTTILTVNDLPTNLLYSESFPYLGPSGNFPLTSVGWAAAIPDTPTRLYQTQPGAGTGAIYNSESSAGTTAFYATTASDTGVSGLPFPSINIASASDLTFAVDVEPTFQPTNVTVSLAVQINGANWYVSTGVLPVNNSSTATSFTTVTQAFSPTAANWKNLTLTGTGATIGNAATADLSGNITGAGLVSVFTGAGNFNFDNFQITGTIIPNPGNISVASRTATTFTLNWTASPNVQLQSATNLTPPVLWSDVPGTAGQGFATITETNTQMFFRLIGQ